MQSYPLPKSPKDLADPSNFQTRVLACSAEKGLNTGEESGEVLPF